MPLSQRREAHRVLTSGSILRGFELSGRALITEREISLGQSSGRDKIRANRMRSEISRIVEW